MKNPRIAFVFALGLGLGGCQADEEETLGPREDARSVGPVIAKVGGRAIGASDVAARMADGLDREAALDALIEEELLLHEAARRGITGDDDTQRALERKMVRAMLQDFERELTPESISLEEVRADFEEHRAKLQVPERRRSWHILVKDPGEAGQALAESILAEVRRSEDPRSVYERYAAGGVREDRLEVIAEELPLMTPRASIEKPYKDALFTAKSPGLLKNTVSTSYGWHVIVLTEIVPEARRTLEDVEEEIRIRLSQKKRFEKLVATVQSLEAAGLVRYEEPNVERLLSMTGLPEPPD